MDWIQFSLFFISIVGMFFWSRSESLNDIKHMDQKLETQRNMILEVHKENNALIKAIHEEIKDFHGRLCTIEERYRSGR